nr:hypothetical protein Iba_chr07fCG7090 [Ipomoea batatas]
MIFKECSIINVASQLLGIRAPKVPKILRDDMIEENDGWGLRREEDSLWVKTLMSKKYGDTSEPRWREECFERPERFTIVIAAKDGSERAIEEESDYGNVLKEDGERAIEKRREERDYGNLVK